MSTRMLVWLLGLWVLVLTTGCRSVPTPSSVPGTATALPTFTVTTPVATLTTLPSTATPLPLPTVMATPAERIVLMTVGAQSDVPGLLHVAGRAQVFEASVTLRLRRADGQVITQGMVHASQGAPEWGDFAVDILYPPSTQDQPVTLEAFEESPRDGSPQSLVSAPVILQAEPELVTWSLYVNPELQYQVRYPANWFVNQGNSDSSPPRTAKFSTYQAEGIKTLEPQDAELWISHADTPSLAEMQDLESKGYQKRYLILSGRGAVRYTDRNPHFGVYDVVYTLSGAGEYRVYLSAMTHDFDSIFVRILSTLQLPQ